MRCLHEDPVIVDILDMMDPCTWIRRIDQEQPEAQSPSREVRFLVDSGSYQQYSSLQSPWGSGDQIQGVIYARLSLASHSIFLCYKGIT